MTENHVDFWNLIAVERYGCPPGWQWVSAERIGDGDQAVSVMKGGIFLTPFKSGPRKGRINLKKPEAGSERTIAVPFTTMDAFEVEWQTKTGKCRRCQGDGTQWTGWSRDSGNRFVECRFCKGSGKAAP